ncbi:E3 ubiquitin-protein ligase At3g02290-like [Hibiscus syriacus]|uniref:E3 ubiquitin-protein ligase At3g02290-like n=1 Tax=Hibiscus syriacus TaxID=106335 RepID=UPI001921EB00|nr:E3 ubiquitin-protein ligase At3g02290-like [Hibiscus syriacus]
MDSVCSCLHAEDFEDYMNPNSNIYRNCLCLGCFFQNFIHTCTTLFQRGELHSVPSSIQGIASMNSSASLDNSLSNMYFSAPWPLPCDSDTRYFRLQCNGLVSRLEKGSSHSQGELEPLRGEDDAGPDSLSLRRGEKWNACEQGSTEQHSKSSQLSSTKTSVGIENIYPLEEEDICPTCLEEYTVENPKIITKFLVI